MMAKYRGEKPLTRKAKILGIAVACVLSPGIVLVSTAASHGDRDSDFAAANFSRTSLSAAISAAQLRLDDGDPADAAIFAKRALDESPISPKALRILGLAEQAQNHQAEAAAIFSQASALGWRDIPTQLWLAQAELASGNNGAGVQRIDAALRAAPYSHPLHLLVDQLALSDPLTPEIAQRMVLHPFWRNAYVTDIQGSSSKARMRLFSQLFKMGDSPTHEEMPALAAILIRDGYAAQARKIWSRVKGLPPSPLFDPAFSHVETADGIPFSWSLLPVVGSDIQQGNQESPSGITVTTDGSASGVLARQLIILPPGEHNLAVNGSVPLAARTNLRWSIRCDSPPKTLLDSDNASGSSVRFNVPATCPFQYLELRVRAAPQAESVTAVYKQLALQ